MMKRFNYLAVLLLVALFFGGCKNLQKMIDRIDEVQYEVTPSPLEMHGDQVKFDVTIKFPKEYFVKKALLSGTPVLKYGDQELEMNKLEAKGEDAEGNGKTISYDNGGSVTISNTFNYDDEMRVSTLMLPTITGEYKGKIKEVPVPENKQKLAVGIITTPELVKKGLDVDNTYASGSGLSSIILATTELQATSPPKFVADIHYVIQKYNVRSSEKNADDVKEFIENVKQAVANPKQEFKSLHFSSYASPDGPERLNDGLADNRNSAAEDYILDMLEDEAELEVEEEKITKEATPEDWEGFKEEMQKSNIQDKELVLRVLSTYDDPEVREREIKNISAAFTEIAEVILPRLRRSVVTAEFTADEKSEEEIIDAAKSTPEHLTPSELMFAAQKVESLDDKLAIYKAFSEKFPNDWRGPNNVGAIYAYQGKTAQAKTQFEKAHGMEENATTLNNMGYIELADGNYAEAENYFNSASAQGGNSSATNYNLGVVSIKKGDYAKAVTYFGSSKTFNAALAKMLNDDNGGAKSVLTDVVSQKGDHAIVHYLKAVLGARMDDATMVWDGLKEATSKDASLKQYAKDDLEFRNFNEESNFKQFTE